MYPQYVYNKNGVRTVYNFMWIFLKSKRMFGILVSKQCYKRWFNCTQLSCGITLNFMLVFAWKEFHRKRVYCTWIIFWNILLFIFCLLWELRKIDMILFQYFFESSPPYRNVRPAPVIIIAIWAKHNINIPHNITNTVSGSNIAHSQFRCRCLPFCWLVLACNQLMALYRWFQRQRPANKVQKRTKVTSFYFSLQ